MRWDGMRYVYEDGSETTGEIFQLGSWYSPTFKGKWLSVDSYPSLDEAKAAVERAWSEDREGTSDGHV